MPGWLWLWLAGAQGIESVGSGVTQSFASLYQPSKIGIRVREGERDWLEVEKKVLGMERKRVKPSEIGIADVGTSGFPKGKGKKSRSKKMGRTGLGN